MAAEAWPLGDDPIDGGSESPDTLDRTEFVQHIVTVLNRVRQQGESSVVGLVADWGAGKSSVVNMTRRLLKEAKGDDAWLIAEYNPWSYSDLDSLIMGFFAELRNALPDKERWKEGRQNLGELAKAVSPLGKIGGIFGLDAEPLMSAAAKLIAGDVSVSAKKAKAEEALKKLGQPILVILDDLDRLSPAELLLVFKLVRLVGHLHNTYYLLCYDEQTLLDVLRRTDLVGDDLGRARDYMEKMVQVRIDLPPLREAQIADYFGNAITAILDAHSIDLATIDVERISAAYTAHLRDRLTTPRAMKRLFAQVDAFYGVLTEEVNFADYLIITFLRTAEAGVYRMLYLNKEELLTLSPGQLTRRVPVESAIDTWRARLTDAGVSPRNLDGVLDLLALLFLPVRAAKDNAPYNNHEMQDVGSRRGVGHADYFDRYFAFGVPAEDIADSVVAEAMRQLSRNEPGSEAAELSRQLVLDTNKVVRKIDGQRDAGPVPTLPLIGVLAGVYSQAASGNLFTSRPRLSITLLTCTLLGDLAEPEGQNVLRVIAATDSGSELAIRAVRTFRQAQSAADNSSLPPLPWIQGAEEVMLEIVRGRLTTAAERPLVEVPCSLFKELLWGWHSLDAAAVQAWLWEQVEAERWSLVDVIVHHSSMDMLPDGRPLPHPVFENLNFDEINGLIGLARIFTYLKDALAAAQDTERPNPDADQEQIRQYVLWLLRDRQERIASKAGETSENSDA